MSTTNLDILIMIGLSFLAVLLINGAFLLIDGALRSARSLWSFEADRPRARDHGRTRSVGRGEVASLGTYARPRTHEAPVR